MSKLWLDDIREPPDKTWIWAKSSREAIGILKSVEIEEISFDHDLGIIDGEDDKGLFVAQYIEIGAYQNTIPNPIVWYVHSANPVGKKDITLAMESAERFWRPYTYYRRS